MGDVVLILLILVLVLGVPGSLGSELDSLSLKEMVEFLGRTPSVARPGPLSLCPSSPSL